ncbi:MAG: DUF2892 domain-containing protein [Ramlibacter sp.]|nr:DUF2892 domain-containing protein [Ramlibacter sp.]
MKQNVGSIDRFVRIAIGIMLLALILVLEGNVRWWGLVGLVPLLTGIFGTCLLYSMFGMSTCRMGGRAAGH